MNNYSFWLIVAVNIFFALTVIYLVYKSEKS